ncbi:MAG TPA: hypothetical protein VFH43_06670 [Candidatus Kapabacteria bacterium]|nr:hypothetical protein [Candidatus Kapabacteria bacterium]
MSATHTDPLHELIRSLTPSEKRYFKLQNKSEGGTKSYLQLFDVLEQQTEYDELAIRKSLDGQKLLNQLHVAKNYLYKQILRSLRSFHAGSDSNTSPLLAFTEHLGDMSILHAKGLFDQSRKSLRKAQAIAEDYDDDLFRLIISTYESDRIAEPVDRKTKAADRFKHKVHLLDRMRSSFSLKRSLEELYDSIALKGIGRSHDHDPLSSITIEELPFSSQIDYCSFKCYYNFSCDAHAEAARWAKQALDLFDAHPHQRDRSTEIYLSFLSNYFTCLQGDDYTFAPEMREAEHFELAVQAFDRVSARTAVQRARVWATRRLAEFEWALLNANDEKLSSLLATFEKEFSSNKKLLSKLEQGWFYYTVAKAYFWTGQLETSLAWVNRLLDDPEFKNYEEYYGQALVFSLILHLELGNTEYLKGAAGSTRRYLESRDLLAEIDRAVLTLIERSLKGDPSEAFSEFIVVIDRLEASKQTRSSIRFFEFRRWLAGKGIEKKSVTL